MSRQPFDPDTQQEQIDNLSAAKFGTLVAEVLAERRSSSDYLIVQLVIEKLTGWDTEHDQVEALIDRLAGVDLSEE